MGLANEIANRLGLSTEERERFLNFLAGAVILGSKIIMLELDNEPSSAVVTAVEQFKFETGRVAVAA
jgi:hypothetical protein